ncbi:nicotinate-nucleotide--dimethylbenzimidazole phosphoribosyltransferase [Streptomyces ruber]|uniref:Nicotinate-nucleotide--dimethylbenzimidazole phosphoribosyltransferase n=2 Tax=Streptomyces TaxID=1883 RepID=A0A918ESF8_9ACTN|nr:nicotinate-nucleotide--dimethylbenzimidazole phosphoribosyltransferase [Streptomyces ruber]GGQ58581.1 nicotinate-nucleotide--dimethylbenzimidazole phosphoribosyltransferase [Streptomyces ruber]
MTDTGQVPGEGLPESAGMVEQPGVQAPGAYTYLSEASAEDEELLLPGAQGAWGNEVPPPAPEPVVQVVHEPGPHETDGRDSGAVDLSAVRTSEARPLAPETGPFRAPVATPVPQPPATRRPPYLAPPTPGSAPSPVRSLADRGPAGAPTHPAAVRQPAQPVSGPEYLDVPRHAENGPGAAPWVTVPAAQAPAPAPAQVAAPPEAEVPASADAVPSAGEMPAEEVPVGEMSAEEVPAEEVPAAEPVAEAAVAETVVPQDAGPTGPTELQGEPTAPAEDAAIPDADAQAPQPAQEPPAARDMADEPAVGPDAAGEQAAPDTRITQDGHITQDIQEAVTAPQPAPAEGGAPAAPLPDAVPPAQPLPDEQPFQAEQPLPEQPLPEQPLPEQPGPAQPLDAQVPDVQAADAQATGAPTATEAEQPPTEIPAGLQQTETQEPEVQEPEVQEPGVQDPEAQGPEVQGPEPVASAAPEPEAEEPEAAQEPESVEPMVQEPVTQEPEAQEPQFQEPQFQESEVQEPEPQGPEMRAEVPAPTVAHPTAPVPAAPTATVPAPRLPEAPADPNPVRAADTAADVAPDPGVAQSAEDLDTRAADQEDEHNRYDQHHEQDQQDQEESTAAVTEAPELQLAGPAAPGYDDAEREAVLRVMRERRDIRNGFRNDPIPHEVLLRVLEAAHTAPSVGHSQPWDFVVIRSAETRQAVHELARRQREAYAKSLPKGRAKQFRELKIEAILDTPVNIVVTADPTRGGRHTLGRHTQPQMAPYSSALAVENLWLAARAEGLGVGWVSFFDEREMVRVLGLPEHLEVVAYLCVGYVDEFPDEPELMQAGWSKRRPLSWVVHEETYGRRALPGEAPHDLLAETVAGIRPLDAKALGEAWERQKRMTKPAGALGMLEIISAQLSGLSRQCPPPIPEPAAVAVFAGDHGVHAQGVTPWPQEVTAQMVANFLGGGAVCNAFATQVGAEVCVVDVGVAAELPATPGLLPRKVRAGTADMTTGPALTREEVKQAIEVGIETARDLVAAGNKALLTGEMGIANTTASAALISVFTETDPAEVTGRGTGINDETLARKTEVVRRALELHQPDPADPIGVLAAVGGLEHAAMVGLLLGGASLRTPVILDGVSAGAAALVARAIAPEVLAACIAGHRSAEPGHVAALKKLGLRPLVDLDLRLGEGTGALLALPMIQSTARAMHEVATFDSAGVTEK